MPLAEAIRSPKVRLRAIPVLSEVEEPWCSHTCTRNGACGTCDCSSLKLPDFDANQGDLGRQLSSARVACPSPSSLRDDENFGSGAYTTPAVIRVHSTLLVAGGTLLLTIAVATGIRRIQCTNWLFPLSTLLFAWRLCTLEVNIMQVDASVLQISMPTTATSPARRAVVVLLMLLVSASWTRAGLTLHAALVGVHMLMTGMHFECTGMHWLLVQLCCASGHVDLIEICLACVHVLAGVQKSRLDFWQQFPMFVRGEVARVTGIVLPESASRIAARSAPPAEVLGGLLVLGASCACCRRRISVARTCSALGNAMLLGYHATAATLLYGQEDAGIHGYNLLCLATALHALCRLYLARGSEQPPSASLEKEPTDPAIEPSAKPSAEPSASSPAKLLDESASQGHASAAIRSLCAPSTALPGGQRLLLLFAICLLMAGLPLSHAVFGDSFWGWHPSASWLIYSTYSPGFGICASDDVCWPPEASPFVAEVRTGAAFEQPCLVGGAREHDWWQLPGCSQGHARHTATWRCLDEALWFRQMPGQAPLDLDIAKAATRFWRAQLLGVAPDGGTPNALSMAGSANASVVLWAQIPQRLSRSAHHLRFACGRGHHGCVDEGHAGGVVLGVSAAILLCCCMWPSVGSGGHQPARHRYRVVAADTVELGSALGSA